MSVAKREEKQGGTEEETNLLTNYWNPPLRRRDEPIKNRTENEEKDSDTHRQEMEEATGREQSGRGEQ